MKTASRGWFVLAAVAASLLTGAASAQTASADRIAVHYINVDQGNSTLVETPCGAILIDAGGRGAEAGKHLRTYLDAFFARRTDLGRRLAAVFVTHTHIDHNSNLRLIAERYGIGGYIHNGRLNGSGSPNARWIVNNAATLPSPFPTLAIADITGRGTTGAVIDPLACEGVDPRIRVLSGGLTANPGWSATEFNNGNNHSLVIRIDYGRASFLFPGDLEEAGIDRLLAKYAGTRALDVDVYEVGHHGSHNGTTTAMVAAMTPEIAVISMGPSTVRAPWTAFAYGHPRRVIVDMLDQAISRPRAAPVSVMVADGARRFSARSLTDAIYATGWDGDVVLSAGADGVITVQTAP